MRRAAPDPRIRTAPRVTRRVSAGNGQEPRLEHLHFQPPPRVFTAASRSQNVLWDGLLTPEGSDRVPNDLRIYHDMIALLQENKIRKREIQFQRTLADTPNRKRHFGGRVVSNGQTPTL